MSTPHLTIELAKIEHNTRTVVGLCGQHGIEVAGVTKVVCGHPEVAGALLRGGVASIADSRFENLRRMQSAGVPGPYLLLRLPPLSGIEQTIDLAAASLNSELKVLEALSAEAVRRGTVHEVIVMVDIGDLREGIWHDQLTGFFEPALALPALRIVGLGANLACLSGIVPSEMNMQRFVDLAEDIEHQFGIDFQWLSALNSSALELIASGRLPSRINHARIGEGILLGRETTHRRAWPGTFQDAFLLHAEVLELKRKPRRPLGEATENAFGQLTAAPRGGEAWRALINVGREDVAVEGMTPTDPRLNIIGATSGYTVLEFAGDDRHGIDLGATLTFDLNYGALLAAMTSEYVNKKIL